MIGWLRKKLAAAIDGLAIFVGIVLIMSIPMLIIIVPLGLLGEHVLKPFLDETFGDYQGLVVAIVFGAIWFAGWVHETFFDNKSDEARARRAQAASLWKRIDWWSWIYKISAVVSLVAGSVQIAIWLVALLR